MSNHRFVKTAVENDSKEMFTFLKEENEKSRAHELKLFQLMFQDNSQSSFGAHQEYNPYAVPSVTATGGGGGMPSYMYGSQSAFSMPPGHCRFYPSTSTATTTSHHMSAPVPRSYQAQDNDSYDEKYVV